ncbi:MAG TPA: NADH:ubiquinone reductase (Na(+)-transporting) subunit F, partial [Bacteroidales bacterium]|nr:NADH:ubiquinone reductase (Na(+)-transporting) subunit F [Bacteroidales bacterium]
MIILSDNLGLLLTLGVVTFLLVIIFLVVMLLYAKAKLSPSGPVNISINDDIKL